MPITWKSVDVSDSLSRAANLYQQSIKDVASSLKNTAGSFVDMQSNEATANLEARLAKEQELAQVDALAQMDANQLRQNTSNWIDPTKAREMILGRQAGLEQEAVGNFNEMLAAGDLTGASTALDSLSNRKGFDASGLTTQLDSARWENDLANNTQKAFDTARTAEQKQKAGSILFNKAMKNQEWDKAQLFASNPEEANAITMGRNTQLINKAFPKHAKALATSSVEDLPKVLKAIDEDLYGSGYDTNTIATLSSALSGLRQSAVQKIMDTQQVAEPAQKAVQDTVTRAPEVAKTLLKDEYSNLEILANKEGISGAEVESLGKLSSQIKDFDGVNSQVDFSNPTGIKAAQELIEILDQNARWGFGDDFGVRELQTRIADAKIDTKGLTWGHLASALSSVEFNTVSSSDSEENALLKEAIERERAKQVSRLDTIAELNAKKQALDKKTMLLSNDIIKSAVDQSKNFTVAKVGLRGLSGDEVLNLTPEAIGSNLLRVGQNQQKALMDAFKDEANKEANVKVRKLEEDNANLSKKLDELSAALGNRPKLPTNLSGPNTANDSPRSRARILSESEKNTYRVQQEENKKVAQNMMRAEFEQLRNKPNRTQEESERLMYLMQRVGM